MLGKQRKRVRVHLVGDLPTLEGLLVGRRPEYQLAVPTALLAAGAKPQELDARLALIPRDRVAWLEVI